MARFQRRSEQVNTEQENINRWLVSYADYMTLMFALFVALYALSLVKEHEFEILSQSLGDVFQMSGEQGTGSQGDGVLPQQIVQEETAYGNNLLPERGPELVDEESFINDVPQENLGQPLEAIAYDLQAALYDQIEQGKAELEFDDEWLTIELSGSLLFPSASASFNPEAADLLQEITHVLNSVKNFIHVRGYTDNLAINNEVFSSNWQLSAARAAAVTNLLQQQGIVQGRLAIEAYGENKPLENNQTAQGRARNRRVEIALSKYAFAENNLGRQQIADQLEQLESVSGQQGASDYDAIKVITLPDGRVRITTRRSPLDKDVKSLEDQP